MSDSAEVIIEKTQTLDAMLHQTLNQALVAVGAESGSLMLVNSRHGILQIKARLGTPRPGRETEPVYRIGSEGVAVWVAENKQSYLCPDVDSDEFFVSSRSGKNFSSLLSVPILDGEKVIAVVNADAAETNAFTETDRQRLEQLAQQVAAPIAERMSGSGVLASTLRDCHARAV